MELQSDGISLESNCQKGVEKVARMGLEGPKKRLWLPLLLLQATPLIRGDLNQFNHFHEDLVDDNDMVMIDDSS